MSELLNPRRPAKACQMEGKHLAINGGAISLQLASLLLLKLNRLVERPVSASISLSLSLSLSLYIYIYIYICMYVSYLMYIQVYMYMYTCIVVRPREFFSAS